MRRLLPFVFVAVLVLCASGAFAQGLGLDTSTGFGAAYLHDMDTGSAKVGLLMTTQLNEPAALQALRDSGNIGKQSLAAWLAASRFALVVENQDPVRLGIGYGIEFGSGIKNVNLGLYWTELRAKPSGGYVSWVIHNQ